MLVRISIFISLIVSSAIIVLINAHETRQMYKRIYELQQEQQALHVMRGQLLIERSSLATPARVERRAHEELLMFVPDVADIRVIEQ